MTERLGNLRALMAEHSPEQLNGDHFERVICDGCGAVTTPGDALLLGWEIGKTRPPDLCGRCVAAHVEPPTFEPGWVVTVVPRDPKVWG
jgi:hypothetical protein